jgi:2-dehydropantoate 2-reductase
MKIAIAGAGAMGGRFGYMLKKSGQEVILIDNWKEHVDNINQNGLIVDNDGTEEVIPFEAYSSKEVKGKADIIILFVKAMQLPSMLSDIKTLIDDNTKVICLLNGLGHVETMEEYLPKKNIFIGVTMWTAGIVGPGHIHISGDGGIELQNIEKGEQEAGKEIVEIFSKAGLKAKYSENVLGSIWKKACVNGALNGLCAVLDCNLHQFGQIPEVHDVVVKIVEEFAALAKASVDVTLDKDATIALIESTYDPEKQGKHYPSMHQDLVRNHRPTEIDYINGYVARNSKKYNLNAPYCELITTLVHGKEKILGII